jgi:hypothetical protein
MAKTGARAAPNAGAPDAAPNAVAPGKAPNVGAELEVSFSTSAAAESVPKWNVVSALPAVGTLKLNPKAEAVDDARPLGMLTPLAS